MKDKIQNIKNHELITAKSKNEVTYNFDHVAYSAILNLETTNVRENHNHLDTDT